MKLAWLENTRIDLAFEFSQIAQVTRTMFESDVTKHCKRLNTAIKYAHDTKTSIRIPKLDTDLFRIVSYSDVAFANNADLFSQLGYIIILIDATNKALPVSYKSYKSRRIARSILSAEVIAFAVLSDDTITFCKQL